jgi:hypothetical protein
MRLILLVLTFIISCAGRAEAIDAQYLAKQKMTLMNKDFDQYFGRSLFLKIHSRENNELRFENDILDVLAFAQLCQFEMARETSNTLTDKPLSDSLSRKLVLAKEYVELKAQLELKNNNLKVQGTKKDVRAYKWPMTNEMLKNLTSPTHLRLRIESQCKS